MKTKQPNSSMCFVCGVENPVGLHLHFYQTEPGVVETTYTAPEHFQGYPGVLHGGIIATILDETSGRAFMGDPKHPRFMYTAKMEIKYRKNVPTGQPLRIVGKAIKSKGHKAQGWAGIYNQDGVLLAEASTVLVDIPEHVLADVDLEALGWRVYPDTPNDE